MRRAPTRRAWAARRRSCSSSARARTGRQVHHQQAHAATRQQRTGQAEALLRIRRTDDQQPAQVHAPADRLHRVEGAGEVQPGHDVTAGLGLRDAAQRQRGLAARRTTADDDAGLRRQPRRPEDGIQRREAGGDDARPGASGVWTRCPRVGVREHREGEGAMDGRSLIDPLLLPTRPGGRRPAGQQHCPSGSGGWRGHC